LDEKIFIGAHACEIRLLEAEKIRRYFIKNNYKIVNTPKEADIIVFIGCAVVEKTADSALAEIKNLQKNDAEIFVVGCIPLIERKKLKKIFNGITINTRQLEKIDELFPENKVKFKDIDDANVLFPMFSDESKPIGTIKKMIIKVPWLKKILDDIFGIIAVAFKNIIPDDSSINMFFTKNPIFSIKISMGCNGNCSYCAVKKAIGKHKSKPIEECIKEFRKGLDEGYKNFVLETDDTGPYGLDINSSLPELLDKLTEKTGNYKITFGNLSPQWLTRYVDDLEEIFKRNKIKRVGFPIQSASPRILKLMNRYTNIEKTKKSLLKLKKISPNLLMETHFIIGFPTETDEEFNETLSFIEEIEFDMAFLYPFSCRMGTAAEKIKMRVPQNVIFKRVEYAKKYLRRKGYIVINKPEMNAISCYKR